MGLEANCNARYVSGAGAKQSGEGRAMWETDYLLFRGPFRVKIQRPEIQKITAAKGVLRFAYLRNESLELDLGEPAAAKWLDKILHPPTRLDKLGVKPGMRVSVLRVDDSGFVGELEARGADVSTRARKDSDIVFAGASIKADLDFGAWRAAIQPAGEIWVIYPKGGKSIRESEVRANMDSAGLVDTKVCAFSSVLTAMKCVIPAADRGAVSKTRPSAQTAK
ncbi:MAG: hypothetical protein ABI823_04585 [Bryobacteraceae bacterium]